jgi:ADP-glucose type glycogen/starch synthase
MQDNNQYDPIERMNPRILIVTPEITYLPDGMGNLANIMKAKAGGMADVSASLVSALFALGADVHVALPHYRQMFNKQVGDYVDNKLALYRKKLPDTRIHLAEDRVFYYRDEVYADGEVEPLRIALAFQREVINNIIGWVQPDLIHCNDWMTGLIPAMARRLDIRCLLTIHNIHTREMTLAQIEDAGIDAADFWQYLYYQGLPQSYEQTRNDNVVDLLGSGIFASHFINTVSPTFLHEMVDGHHDFVPEPIRHELRDKVEAGCARGILNAPDPSFDPQNDHMIPHTFNSETQGENKRKNKIELQRHLGLAEYEEAPILYWPSRLDPTQKGCQLVAELLPQLLHDYWDRTLQVVIVANGAYKGVFHDIVNHNPNIRERMVVCDFFEELSHWGYAASDYILMPSRFEPCGLPQMVGVLYGSLPIAFDTGGLHDTVEHLNPHENTGNGFVFGDHNAAGLRWAIDEALRFHAMDVELRNAQIARIMNEGAQRFTHAETARHYFDIYESMLERPLVNEF